MHYDIFNGDADGIFALHQYRLVHPQPEAQLLSGVKRDIQLLAQLEEVHNSSLTVFDISLYSNLVFLERILNQDNSVRYFDHHFAGTPPRSPLLETHINVSASHCTCLIVNEYLGGLHPLWAICGAFGDNLHEQARHLATDLHLTQKQVNQLQELGELVNYNGYGSTLEDLHFTPEHMYRAIEQYESPFHFSEDAVEMGTLRDGYQDDLEQALALRPMEEAGTNRIYHFPDAPWARRVVGVFSNLKARQQPASAHAVITDNKDSTLRISVRAPLERRQHADTLCKLFPSGGGRAAAAGINSLPKDELDRFLEKFNHTYS